jgi:leucyl aminopeptidase
MPHAPFELTLAQQAVEQTNAAVVVLPVVPASAVAEDTPDTAPVALALAPLVDAAITAALPVEALLAQAKSQGFKGSCCGVWSTALASPVGSITHVVLVGLGELTKLQRGKVAAPFNKALSHVLAWDKTLAQAVTVVLPAPYEAHGGSLANDAEHPQAIDATTLLLQAVDGLTAATYKSNESKKPASPLKQVTLIASCPQQLAESQATLPLALALSAGRSLAKDLVNEPANIKTTQTMVKAAQALVAAYPELTLTMVDDPDVLAKEMPCFFEVAKGALAYDPPVFIHLTYKGGNPTTKLAFVGKSLMFDTGGYQVKPGNSMVTMKGDMAGGASVLGALKTVAMMKPDTLQLDVYLAATNNRIDANAMVPDAIVNTTCGKTVEIRHTDAEGRLTLIDAVAKAALTQPDALVTVATLTGAAMRAVGRSIALMANNTRWGQKVLEAANEAGDPVQVLDVTSEDFDNIKSKIDGADLRNTSRSDNRGAQSAAAFVMSGAPKGLPVVHLDIAGADMTDAETATAYSVRTLAHLALRLA